MHHSHTEDAMLNQKIAAIINCFIDSNIPPSLQIDIPQDMADRILEHKHERGPYLFREAQLAAFRILLQHWQPFVEFRNNMMTTERAKTTLERHRLLARKREQEYREAMELQRERERLQRLEEEAMAAEGLEDDERGAKLGFSYSAYLQEMLVGCVILWSGIPEFPDQPVEERPGYVADPEAAGILHYSERDYAIYKEFLQKKAEAASMKSASQGTTRTSSRKLSASSDGHTSRVSGTSTDLQHSVSSEDLESHDQRAAAPPTADDQSSKTGKKSN
ncbi:regulator of G-protein signaling 22 [Plakobranchus ocellatus]|uniref:Regulator of G-protein signaling 22 n=1 Tax=Plakobranchus ocellatus TaxID=259542 RepID=A0AAV3Y996_9GAST|nr:regulator of G-protein signaling 22 [Plakobranchus ocellatus]